MANKLTSFFSKLIGSVKSDDEPPYPINPQTNRIILPSGVKQEIADLVKAGNTQDATRRVRGLTGADEKTAAAFVSRMAQQNKKKKRSYRRS
ncbi:MAG: hypothetical protein KC418_18585 [Anaerolineales bacterium]|nr:hypothetical protein [Anaerolineales bacterium]MCB8953998.1 hypothetical protein [Ardenticatenales bacterium]